MRRKRPPIEVEILEKDEYSWFARVRLKTTVIEMAGDSVSPREVDKLLTALARHVGGRLIDAPRYFAGWRLYGGVDTEWAEWVRLGWVLPDDPKQAWKFSASKYPKRFEARFFTPELGPFALSLAVRKVAPTVGHVKVNPYHPTPGPVRKIPLSEWVRLFEELKAEWGW